MCGIVRYYIYLALVLNISKPPYLVWVSTFGESDVPKIRQIELKGTQFEIYRRIAARYSHAFLFESLSGPDVLAETSIIGFDPDATAVGYQDRLVITHRDGTVKTIKTDNPITALRAVIGKHDEQKYRYMGGAVGIIEYEAAGLWESRLAQDTDMPLMEFGIYSDGILFDNKENKPYYFHTDKNRSSQLIFDEPEQEPFSYTEIRAEPDEAEYGAMIKKAKAHIYDGDIFQAVLSRRFSFEFSGEPMRVYEKLRNLNPSPYLYHMKMGDRSVMGASPEMLIRVTGNQVETFPIAGTRPTTVNLKRNAYLGDEMTHDKKEVAEHVMLVDLGRNDIGRVCALGTVDVKSLMAVKQFSHVQHMVTHVTGRLAKEYDSFDAFGAVFPAGTVTGAPKVRAMEIISDIERKRRGGYAGAVGYFSSNGCCDFAIAIRSMFLERGAGYVQSGAGIVADSVASREFQETEHKAGALIAALSEAAK